MKLKLTIEKHIPVLDNGVAMILEELHYLCPCGHSKVIYLGEINPNKQSFEEDILCDYSRMTYDIVPNTKASELNYRYENLTERSVLRRKYKDSIKRKNRKSK